MVFQSFSSTSRPPWPAAPPVDPVPPLADTIGSVITVRELARMIKIDGILRPDEPMSAHTSFRIGGPADLYVAPSTADEAGRVLGLCRTEGVSVLHPGRGNESSRRRPRDQGRRPRHLPAHANHRVRRVRNRRGGRLGVRRGGAGRGGRAHGNGVRLLAPRYRRRGRLDERPLL